MHSLLTWCLGRPTMEGKTALGASSPAKPALHMPEPLSTTKAATSSSHMLDYLMTFLDNKMTYPLHGFKISDKADESIHSFIVTTEIDKSTIMHKDVTV